MIAIGEVDGAGMIREAVRAEVDELARRFASAQPFRHVVVDDFLDPAFARRLLDGFPAFDVARARNEHGAAGNKAVHEGVRALGPAFVEFDTMARDPAFLALVSAVTGIPALLYDPHWFGGGAHDNRDGQALDAHVDFNRHPVTHSHRRLNLIVYLNPGWQDGWGGVLELHRDPRAADDEVVRVVPAFNRMVLFETTESSWHGFTPIHLPPEAAGTSRKSVALYYYTAARPAEETAGTHSTVYVDPPLPAHFVAGHVLDAEDVEALRVLLARRDQHVQRLYGDLQRAQGKLEQALRQVGLARGSLPWRTAMAVRRGWRRLRGGA
jgi:hypothetical protein